MDKLPTNEKLQGEDCNIVSMCSLCEMACKTSNHLLCFPFLLKI